MDILYYSVQNVCYFEIETHIKMIILLCKQTKYVNGSADL